MPPIWYGRLTAHGMFWRIAQTSLTVWRMPCKTEGNWVVSCQSFLPPQLPRHIDPFVELCLDMLRQAAPTGRAALLTPGHADPAWYAHVLLARELSCVLVEGGDLTVRDGGLFLKTLRGLQPIGVLLRGIDGRLIDPLELEPDGVGAPGLLAAARDHVRVLNSPGSSLVEAPALAAFLPNLATPASRQEACAAQCSDGLAG